MAIDHRNDAVDGNADEDEGEPEQENQGDFAVTHQHGCTNEMMGLTHRLSIMADFMTIGTGKHTRRRSVITSLAPIVISCAYP